MESLCAGDLSLTIGVNTIVHQIVFINNIAVRSILHFTILAKAIHIIHLGLIEI